jgi:predicted transcriptional regulator
MAKMHIFSVNLPDETVKQLDELARESGTLAPISRAAVLRAALALGLATLVARRQGAAA